MEKNEVKRVVVTERGLACAGEALTGIHSVDELCPETHCSECSYSTVNSDGEEFEIGDTLILYDDGSVELQKAK